MSTREFHLQFVEAIGLRTVQQIGVQDPYVSAFVASVADGEGSAVEPVRCPPAHDGGCNPAWKEPQELLQLSGTAADVVEILVLNRNLLVPDDFIGKASLGVGRLLEHSGRCVKLRLQPQGELLCAVDCSVQEAQRAVGAFRRASQAASLSAAPAAAGGGSPSSEVGWEQTATAMNTLGDQTATLGRLLTLDIRRARCLPDVQALGTQDPYVSVVTLPTRSARGATLPCVGGDTEPVWAGHLGNANADTALSDGDTGNVSAIQLIPHPTDRWVRVEVWNSNVFFDTLIGAVNIALADCPSRPVRTWQQLDGGGLVDMSMAIEGDVEGAAGAGAHVVGDATDVSKDAGDTACMEAALAAAVARPVATDIESDGSNDIPSAKVEGKAVEAGSTAQKEQGETTHGAIDGARTAAAGGAVAAGASLSVGGSNPLFDRTARARDALPTKALQIEVRAAQGLRDVQILGSQDPYVVATLCSATAHTGASDKSENGSDGAKAEGSGPAGAHGDAKDDLPQRVRSCNVRVACRHSASGGTNPQWTSSHRNRLLLVPKSNDTAVLLEVMNSNYFADNKIGTTRFTFRPPSIDFDVPTVLKLSSGGTLVCAVSWCHVGYHVSAGRCTSGDAGSSTVAHGSSAAPDAVMCARSSVGGGTDNGSGSGVRVHAGVGTSAEGSAEEQVSDIGWPSAADARRAAMIKAAAGVARPRGRTHHRGRGRARGQGRSRSRGGGHGDKGANAAVSAETDATQAANDGSRLEAGNTHHAQRLRAEHEHADHALDVGSLADSVAGLVTEAGDWEEQDWEGAAALASGDFEDDIDFDAVDWADGPSEAEWEAAIEAAVNDENETQLSTQEQHEDEGQGQHQEVKLQAGNKLLDTLPGDEVGGIN